MSDVVCSITVKVLQYYSDVVCSIMSDVVCSIMSDVVCSITVKGRGKKKKQSSDHFCWNIGSFEHLLKWKRGNNKRKEKRQ